MQETGNRIFKVVGGAQDNGEIIIDYVRACRGGSGCLLRTIYYYVVINQEV